MIAAFLLLFVILGYFVFPGHTYLQSDTQIYIPMLERAWDPSLFSKDMVAVKPHLAYTIYDEVALAMRWVTGMRFETALGIQQFIFRLLGVCGIFMIASCHPKSRRGRA